MKYKLNNDYKIMYENAVQALMIYLKVETNLKSLVLGVSGGIDSAVTAALARTVVDNVTGVKLIGRVLPISAGRIQAVVDKEMARAVEVCKSFCDSYKVVDLDTAFRYMMEHIENIGTECTGPYSFEDKIRRGNVMARIRMIQLFHIAHATNGMVLGTDNLTEYMLGFWTLHGDVGNYRMTQNLWKTEVYGVAHHIVGLYVDIQEHKIAKSLMECIFAVPTDGLGITDSDFDQLGADSYLEIDRILIDYLNGKDFDPFHPVLHLHRRTYFKREDPISIPRRQLLG